MSLESHLQQLLRKHKALDEKIAAEERRPGVDRMDVMALKKRKLRLKELIERARTSAAA